MICVGLDISKDSIDAHIIDHLQTWFEIENSGKGWEKLRQLLAKHEKEDVRICCEYTGIYYLGVAAALHEDGYHVCVANAYSIRYYARLKMARTKTDKQDAALIAGYLRVNNPPQWQPLPQAVRDIKALNRRLGQLMAIRTMETNRMQVADDNCKASHQRLLAQPNEEIKTVEAALQATIGEDEHLKDGQKLPTSIPGIGTKAAAVLLPVVADIERFPTARHLVSYLGLSPIQRESGTSVRGRSPISKMGDKHIRTSLYMPARPACLRSRVFRDWANALMERGKHPKVVYVMMIRRLAVYAWHVVKQKQLFDESLIKRG